MANAQATDEAIEIAKAQPKLGVGCHVVLVDGQPLTDASGLSSLVQPGSQQFRKALGGLAVRALAGQLDQDQVQAEATAQFRKLQTDRVSLTHFDTHKHTHMFPAVLEGLLRAARTCGLPAMRNPFEPPQSFVSILSNSRTLWKRSLQTRALRLMRKEFDRLVKRSGLRTTDGTIGIAATGALDASIFQRILEALPEGTWEFVFHPGYCDDDLHAAGTRLLESRHQELQLLTAPETRARLQNSNIDLISFADL
jgi:chitin disaccharide deacetylase